MNLGGTLTHRHLSYTLGYQPLIVIKTPLKVIKKYDHDSKSVIYVFRSNILISNLKIQI